MSSPRQVVARGDLGALLTGLSCSNAVNLAECINLLELHRAAFGIQDHVRFLGGIRVVAQLLCDRTPPKHLELLGLTDDEVVAIAEIQKIFASERLKLRRLLYFVSHHKAAAPGQSLALWEFTIMREEFPETILSEPWLVLLALVQSASTAFKNRLLVLPPSYASPTQSQGPTLFLFDCESADLPLPGYLEADVEALFYSALGLPHDRLQCLVERNRNQSRLQLPSRRHPFGAISRARNMLLL